MALSYVGHTPLSGRDTRPEHGYPSSIDPAPGDEPAARNGEHRTAWRSSAQPITTVEAVQAGNYACVRRLRHARQIDAVVDLFRRRSFRPRAKAVGQILLLRSRQSDCTGPMRRGTTTFDRRPSRPPLR